METKDLHHSITLQTINNVNDKLNWSIRSLDKIKVSQHNKIEVQDNFWAFLTAFHNGWNYYNRLISLLYPEISKTKRSEKASILIEDWKNKELIDAEKSSWNTLNKIRNFDIHHEPIKPEIVERECLLIADAGIYLVNEKGQFLSAGTITKYFVYFDEEEYEIIALAEHGVSAIKKFIKFISLLT